MQGDFIQVLRYVQANEKFVARKVDPILKEAGLEGLCPFEFQEPVEIEFIPTLRLGVNRPITEMLKSRFLFAARMVII